MLAKSTMKSDMIALASASEEASCAVENWYTVVTELFYPGGGVVDSLLALQEKQQTATGTLRWWFPILGDETCSTPVFNFRSGDYNESIANVTFKDAYALWTALLLNAHYKGKRNIPAVK
ncbi:hypothetical protein QL285_003295 [Trifolium repens]|nr:hypothetical protein QL285_003295 [Trifolium repens]